MNANGISNTPSPASPMNLNGKPALGKHSRGQPKPSGLGTLTPPTPPESPKQTVPNGKPPSTNTPARPPISPSRDMNHAGGAGRTSPPAVTGTPTSPTPPERPNPTVPHVTSPSTDPPAWPPLNPSGDMNHAGHARRSNSPPSTGAPNPPPQPAEPPKQTILKSNDTPPSIEPPARPPTSPAGGAGRTSPPAGTGTPAPTAQPAESPKPASNSTPSPIVPPARTPTLPKPIWDGSPPSIEPPAEAPANTFGDTNTAAEDTGRSNTPAGAGTSKLAQRNRFPAPPKSDGQLTRFAKLGETKGAAARNRELVSGGAEALKKQRAASQQWEKRAVELERQLQELERELQELESHNRSWQEYYDLLKKSLSEPELALVQVTQQLLETNAMLENLLGTDGVKA